MEGADSGQPVVDAMSHLLAEVIRFSAAAEKIGAAARACKLPLEILETLEGQDPELRPELLAAASQLTEVVQALTRAHTFVDARLEARLETISESLNHPEGGTPA